MDARNIKLKIEDALYELRLKMYESPSSEKDLSVKEVELTSQLEKMKDSSN